MTRIAPFLIVLVAALPTAAQAEAPACDQTKAFVAPDAKGESMFGCLEGKQPIRLGSPGFHTDRWGDHQDTWELVRTKGHFAAFERGYFGCPSFHCRKSELNVYDLRSGRRTIRRITEPGEPYFVGASDVALATDGSLAWISLRDGRLWLLRAHRRKPKHLDFYADPRSLSVYGRKVSWSSGGEWLMWKLD